ncbi:MAG: ATP-binding protein [Bacteroidales bacterium]
MSLKNLLDEIKNLFIHKIDLKKLDFNVQVQPGFPDAVMLDEIHIKQVIFNLVGNAIKFTHAGYIRLSISHQMVSEDEADITFAVADSGIGIPKSQHVRIFEAFTQQPGHSNPNFGGVGLGLAITKRLVDKMGGSINLESEKGRGSEFTVMLPGIKICDVALKSSEMQHYHTSAIRFNPATMLVIDDVSSNIDAVESMLSDSGLKIMRAETAEIGLELLNQNKPDIILLDIRLPGMDGFEMAKKIKNNPDTKNIPVLAFTASVFSLDRLNKASGFDGVLFKPVSIHMLNNGLKKFLRYVEPVMGKTLQKAGNNFFSMSLLTRENISTVQKTIDEELLPQWEKLKDSFVLYKIDSFIARLAGFSKKYQIESFAAYAQQLEEDMEIVDLESLQHNLRKFPEITNELKRYISDNLM